MGIVQWFRRQGIVSSKFHGLACLVLGGPMAWLSATVVGVWWAWAWLPVVYYTVREADQLAMGDEVNHDKFNDFLVPWVANMASVLVYLILLG